MMNLNDINMCYYLINSSHICGICQRFNLRRAYIVNQLGKSTLLSDGEEYVRCGILLMKEDEERSIELNGEFCPKLEKYMIDQGDGSWDYETLWGQLTQIPYPGPIPSIWRLVFGLWLISEWNTDTGEVDLTRLMEAIEDEGFEGGRVTTYFNLNEEWVQYGEEEYDEAQLTNSLSDSTNLLPLEDRPFIDDCTRESSMGTSNESHFF